MRRTLLATVIALVAACGIAEAQRSRQAISRCRPQSPADLYGFRVRQWMANIDQTRRITVVCPSLDTSVQPDSGVSEIRVYGYDWSETDGLAVRACRTDRVGGDSACSEWESSGNVFVGETVLTLNPGSTWSGSDFGFLEIRIPRYDSNGSLVFGWVTEP